MLYISALPTTFVFKLAYLDRFCLSAPFKCPSHGDFGCCPFLERGSVVFALIVCVVLFWYLF